MVLKSNPQFAIKPLRNVKQYTSWTLPSINSGEGKIFRKETADEKKRKEEKAGKLDAEQVEKKKEPMVSVEELQAIKDKAYDEGFKKGRQKGLASGKEEVDRNIQLFTQMVGQLSEPLNQCGEKVQQELLELAFAISRQIVRRELKQDPTQLVAIIREALKKLPIGSKNIQVLLNPEDAQIVREVLSIDQTSPESHWQLVEEPSMERGGCSLKTNNSNVDASVDRQIAILFSRVAGERLGETGQISEEVEEISEEVGELSEEVSELSKQASDENDGDELNDIE